MEQDDEGPGRIKSGDDECSTKLTFDQKRVIVERALQRQESDKGAHNRDVSRLSFTEKRRMFQADTKDKQTPQCLGQEAVSSSQAHTPWVKKETDRTPSSEPSVNKPKTPFQLFEKQRARTEAWLPYPKVEMSKKHDGYCGDTLKGYRIEGPVLVVLCLGRKGRGVLHVKGLAEKAKKGTLLQTLLQTKTPAADIKVGNLLQSSSGESEKVPKKTTQQDTEERDEHPLSRQVSYDVDVTEAKVQLADIHKETSSSIELSLYEPVLQDDHPQIREASPDVDEALDDVYKSSDFIHESSVVQIRIEEGGISHKSIEISWPKIDLSEHECYKISYQSLDSQKWIQYDQPFKANRGLVEKLQPDTAYIFKVKIKDEHEDTERSYTEKSEVVKTKSSPLVEVVKRCHKSQKFDNTFVLPITEDKNARNERNCIRKMVLSDTKSHKNFPERTALVVGATGSGKSTWINTIANYCFGVEFNGVRFEMVTLEKCEEENDNDKSKSLTEWITCYTIIPSEATEGRLNYILNIVDTPGFGDTRGHERDMEIVRQITALFQTRGQEGLKHIHALCFLFPASETRLTISQKYVFETMMALFGKDVKPNICIITTFADGQKPNVLNTIKQFGMPDEPYFAFNNSRYFDVESRSDQNDLSMIFWEMNKSSFSKLFKHIESLPTNALALTLEVLDKREKIKNTQGVLREQIKKALEDVVTLEQEIEIFSRHKEEIVKNKDFKYEVDHYGIDKRKFDAESSFAPTNCKVCRYTCHKNCPHGKNDLRSCIVMDPDGYCLACPKFCYFDKHTKGKELYTYTKKPLTKNYKGNDYERYASPQEVIDVLNLKIENHQKVIVCLANLLEVFNEELEKKALRHNPADMVSYFDVMIHAEEEQKTKGYEERIRSLQKCKQMMTVNKDVQEFLERADIAKLRLCNDYENERRSMLRAFRELFFSKK